ncbi:MAG: DJ-1/PfpI family protein [Clostridia bacterium]|nr:DJ-1/PfpI family protein [Clostridia bacterium]
MVYVFLADGFEEIEALTPVDILRRGGAEVITVGVGKKIVTSSHKIPVTADITTDDITDFKNIDAVVLPGGMPGTLNLEKCTKVIDTVKYCVSNNILVGAICAAPSILGHLGVLEGKKATAFPGFEKELSGAILDDYVSQDGMIVTARGMGVSTEFALKLLEILKGAETAKNVKDAIQCR